MTFLPIVSRELRVLSRRRSTYWVRTGSALAVIILGTWMFLAMQRESPQTISNVLFGLLTGTAELYCLFSGVRSTADSLSYEKREGTLGLLFLTDLKGYDVVLGKLVATSVNGLYGVLAVVPMLAVPLLMGGISLAEFGRMALVAVNTLFFSLCIGMFVSSISKHAQRAALGTMLLILIAVAAGPLAGWYLALLNKPRPMQLWPFYPSPGFSYYLAWDIAYVKGAKDFRNSLITIHAIGWVALILSAFIAPRSWKDRPPGVKRLRWRER
jgi:ABC-type transport system involved in multi-copper enzyme maturation permease subunit